MDTDAELDVPDDPSMLATAVPRAVLRAPFMSKELGALRYLAAREGGLVAVFSSGLALHLHGDMSALAAALGRITMQEAR